MPLLHRCSRMSRPSHILHPSFVTGAALLGAFVGAVIFGHFADNIGRRYLYIFDLIFSLSAIIAFISSFVIPTRSAIESRSFADNFDLPGSSISHLTDSGHSGVSGQELHLQSDTFFT